MKEIWPSVCLAGGDRIFKKGSWTRHDGWHSLFQGCPETVFLRYLDDHTVPNCDVGNTYDKR